jgi:cytochrome P450
MARLPVPPGPPQHWLWGNLPEFRRDMLAFYTRMAREYGDISAFRFGPRKLLLLNHPDLIEQVLVTDNRLYTKHFGLRLLRPTLGNGLILSESDFWLRQRRLVQPAFSKQRIESYGSIFVDHTERMLSAWRDGERRDLHRDMMKLTLGIVAKTLLDVDAGDESDLVSEAADAIMVDFNSRFLSAWPPPFWLPVPRNLALKRQVRRLDAIILKVIGQRRAERRDHGDLLSLLVEARDESDRQGMTDRQLRDEVMTMFLAGHETTANALSWTWYLLAKHPHVEACLHGELESVLAGRAPTAADVPRLPYAEQVILEAMRLYPPAYVIGRQPIDDCSIGGYHVPAGTSVLISQWVLHRDPRNFDRPDEFDPDRWKDGLIRRLPKFTYMPFGGGPRTCIGNSFAMLEAILAVATMASRFHMRLVPEAAVAPWASITLRPRNGLHVVVQRRTGRSANTP